MFENKIFIPSEVVENFNNYSCHLVQDQKIISLDSSSTCNSSICTLSTFEIETIHYTYNYKNYSLTSDEFTSFVSQCNFDNYTNFTSDVFYRNDIDSILIIFLILFIIIIFVPYKIISRLFGRWFKI